MKSYNYESGKWFERVGTKLEEIPKSKWMAPGLLFKIVPQIQGYTDGWPSKYLRPDTLVRPYDTRESLLRSITG